MVNDQRYHLEVSEHQQITLQQVKVVQSQSQDR